MKRHYASQVDYLNADEDDTPLQEVFHHPPPNKSLTLLQRIKKFLSL